MEQKLYDAAAKLPETVLTFENIQAHPSVKAPAHPWRKIAALAACLVLLIAVGFGGYAYATEIKEYNQAVQFFADNGLSTEGLTREEIKAVYRDIATESFTYSKTAEVLGHSLITEQIPGYEIDQIDNTLGGNAELTKKDYQYRVMWYDRDENGDHGSIDNSCVEKYDGDTLLWRVNIKKFHANGYTALSDGVMVYGEGGIKMTEAWIIKFGENGDVVWKYMLDNGVQSDYIRAVVENTDGSYAVFRTGWSEEKKCICLNQISADGKDILFKKTEMEDNTIGSAARLGDGYLVRLGSEESKIVKVDYAGNITDSLSYSEGITNYNIQDMIEFNGKLYLSACVSPKIAEKRPDSYTSQEIYDVFALCQDLPDEESKEWKIDITDRIQNHYSAMLLVCDTSTGAPQEFYSVKGAKGGELALSDDGMLLWSVKSYISAYFTPFLNSSIMRGEYQLYCYTFDDTGKLVLQEKGEKVDYF